MPVYLVIGPALERDKFRSVEPVKKEFYVRLAKRRSGKHQLCQWRTL
jgi:hypothetical protein